MCDHCKTYKPLMDGTYYERETLPAASAWVRPQFNGTPRSSASPSDKGCCSWRESCCNGGCCSQVGNCCAVPGSGEIPKASGCESGCRGLDRMRLPTMTNFPPGMPDYTGPDKLPCTSQEKKVPKCFGGDCNDSRSDTREEESEVTICVSMPRESER